MAQLSVSLLSSKYSLPGNGFELTVRRLVPEVENRPESMTKPERFVKKSNKKYLKPFPKQALIFMCLLYNSLKTPREKGEIAHHEQFLIFPSVFYPFRELSAIFIKFVCELFQFGRVQNFSFGKGLKKTDSINLKYITFQLYKLIPPGSD